ncbi:MAG: hypothetical protein ACK5MP_14240 [Nostocoides sp.]
MAQTPLERPAIWAEFTDPGEPRRRYRCDLTWLTSRWTCIYGRGCPGMDAEVPESGCCAVGAFFSSQDDLTATATLVADLTEDLWQFHPGSTDPQAWTEVLDDPPGTKTAVAEGACIFLNRDDAPTGRGCALHHLAVSRGEDPTLAKPQACWQMPIQRQDRYVDLPDGTRYVETTITEYDRRQWGLGGADMHWFCTNEPAAHVGGLPLYQGSRAELIALMGLAAYEQLSSYADAHLAHIRTSRDPEHAARLPLLVHPATLAAATHRRAGPPAATPRSSGRH